jgi:hypothetical protein
MGLIEQGSFSFGKKKKAQQQQQQQQQKKTPQPVYTPKHHSSPG